MILQPILFPKETICKETKLYYRNPSVQFGQSFLLQPHQAISFDTYFNSFSLEKWEKYTFIENLYLHLNINGKCKIDLYEAILVNDNVQTRLLATSKKDNQEESITISFPDISTLHGICYFVISSDEESCLITSGYYGTEIDTTQTNKIKIGIGICTYKREEFILKNLKAIQESILDNPQSTLHDNLEIIVSDNGQTLQNLGYTHPKIQIFPNINAGGSGGFTRCMIEAIKAREKLNLTHLLLMDDDIVLDPEILTRTHNFLLFLKAEHRNKLLGGVMLKIEKPHEQLEKGAKRSSDFSGEWCIRNNPDINLSTFHNVLKNELTNSVIPDYNGWWYCCIPICHITQNNLPLPFFIHCDDMEYGCRIAEEIILTNGIAVWHSLKNKENPWIYYYDTRNRLISSIIHDTKSCTNLWNIWKYILINFLFSMTHYNYIEWDIYAKAIKDLCKGANYLKKINPLQLQKELSSFGYKKENIPSNAKKIFLSDEAINEKIIFCKKKNFKRKIQLLCGIINAFLPFGKQQTLCINKKIIEFFIMNNSIFLYNQDTKDGYYLKKRIYKSIIAFIECGKLFILTFFRWKKIQKEFKKSYNLLTSIDFWEKYLQI